MNRGDVLRLQIASRLEVGKNRFVEGKRIESHQAIDIFLLDDGFQHLQLARDLDIVLIDASRPMTQQLLPAGPMREPLSALTRAGIIIFTRTENTAGAKEAIQRLSNLPIFTASSRLLGFRRIGSAGPLQTVAELGNGPFFVFCGVGNPNTFVRDLQRWGITPAGSYVFCRPSPIYTRGRASYRTSCETRRGKRAADNRKRFLQSERPPFPSLPVYVSVIDMEISGETEFLAAINGALQVRGAQA